MTVQEGVTTSSDMQHHDTKRGTGPAGPSADVYSLHPRRVTTTHPRNCLLNILSPTATADRTMLPPEFHTTQVHCAFMFQLLYEADHISEARRNYPNITLRNYCATHRTTDQINNIICALLWLSLNNPTVSHMLLYIRKKKKLNSLLHT